VEKDYGTGGVVALESGTNARLIHVTLCHDREHVSYLEMPIVH
jgi:hypothetical protein